ncbi:MAG: L-threonylcarbamoyladenylate synthase, partial [Plesiomonas shigelloides]
MSQFFYIHPDNPQARLINQAVALLREGAVVV